MNLDIEAIKTVQKIINKTSKISPNEVENLITKTLGVLQENGVYACILYLYSRTSGFEKEVSAITRNELLKMTEFLGKEHEGDEKAEYVLKFLTDNICNDLDTLFLTKQLWEQTLIYARYSAKVRG